MYVCVCVCVGCWHLLTLTLPHQDGFFAQVIGVLLYLGCNTVCVLTVPILIEGEEACREQCAGSLESKTKGNIATSRCSVFIPSTIERKTRIEWSESKPPGGNDSARAPTKTLRLF